MTEQSSTETNELAAALAKARPEMPHPIKNCKNPHFNNEYADQKAIMDAVGPAMAKHGLSVTHQPDSDMMHSYLRHSSGQWLRASLPLILGQRRDMQALGAAITYAKRYLTGALLSLHHDTDDDAESTMARGQAKAKRAPKAKAEPSPSVSDWEGQLDNAKTLEELAGIKDAIPWSSLDKEIRSLITTAGMLARRRIETGGAS
jgi:hypothetical protein